MTINIHEQFDQGSEQWLKARCGLLTASEMKLIVGVEGGGLVTHYRASGRRPEKLTPKREKALDLISGRIGSVSNLCFAADVSDGVIRALITEGAIEPVEVNLPRRFVTPDKYKAASHLNELLAQRITGHVEPHYISDDMLRGHEDEIRARDLYAKQYAPVTTVGFITNDEWGFVIGCSPDWLVGDDGMGEAKSRRQKLQIDTIVTGEVPDDFVIQVQTELLVTRRKWLDFVSYSGGLPMATIRVEPDPVVQEAIEEAATVFEAALRAKLTRYEEAMHSGRRFIATERSVEMEMF